MDDYKKPTNDQIAEMAMAACEAARNKAVELGLDWIYYVLGIERALDASLMTLKTIVALGPERTEALANAIRKANAYDMMQEAERIISND